MAFDAAPRGGTLLKTSRKSVYRYLPRRETRGLERARVGGRVVGRPQPPTWNPYPARVSGRSLSHPLSARIQLPAPAGIVIFGEKQADSSACAGDSKRVLHLHGASTAADEVGTTGKPPPTLWSGQLIPDTALNTIMVFAFAPLVGMLLGVSAITVPWATLVTSVVLYIAMPVALAQRALDLVELANPRQRLRSHALVGCLGRFLAKLPVDLVEHPARMHMASHVSYRAAAKQRRPARVIVGLQIARVVAQQRHRVAASPARRVVVVDHLGHAHPLTIALIALREIRKGCFEAGTLSGCIGHLIAAIDPLMGISSRFMRPPLRSQHVRACALRRRFLQATS